MVIKSKSNINILLCSVLIILLSLYLSFNKKIITSVVYDFYSSLMASDPGFSSIRNLSDTGGNDTYQSMKEKLTIMIGSSYKVLMHKFLNNQSNDLKNIDITIQFKNYKKIKNDRSDALIKGYLSEPSIVNASLEFNNKTYKAKVRLKGDLQDHWTSLKRMSLRVYLKDDETILGFNKFSIQKPRSRQYPYENAFQESLRETGNITSMFKFATITVNGEDWGIMAIEENISKEFLERQKRKDSPVFRFSDDKNWLKFDKFASRKYPNYRYSDSKLITTISKQSKSLKNDLNRKIYTYILEERLKDNNIKIYSESSYLKAFFISLFWNTQHTLSDSNTRHYFNPYTLKLELITMDQEAFSLATEELENILDTMLRPVDINGVAEPRMRLTETYNQILSNAALNLRIDKYFSDALNVLSDIEIKLNKYSKYFPLDAYKSDNILLHNIDLIKNDRAVLDKWLKKYEANSTTIKNEREKIFEMPNKLDAIEFLDQLHVRHYDDGRLLIFNLLPDDVLLKRIIVNKKEAQYKDLVIPGFIQGNYVPYKLPTNYEGILDDQIVIESSYKDIKSSVIAYPTMLSKEIINPLIISSEPKTPFLIKKDINSWEIIQGDWVIRDPLVINGSLTINDSTNLKFSKDSYLIVKGEIKFIGSKTKPIILDSLNSGWKGFYVLSADNDKSILENVVVKNTLGVTHDLLSLTGGINIYGGSVDIKNLDIQGSNAEDALNIVKSLVNIDGLKVKNTISDAFDCDYCMGKIANSSFNDINGDAIDISGSELEIYNIKANNIKDKGLSIGEASIANIWDGSLSNIGVGVAVKDGSKANIEDMNVINYDLYAAMTYSKKKHFDAFSVLNLINISVDGDQPYLRQVNTMLKVDGVEVSEREVNVEKLYSFGVMKK
jgi:hypothetical protein